MVERYKLMESPVTVARLEIEDQESFRALQVPRAAAWIEEQLAGPGFEAMVLVSKRRFNAANDQNNLFPPPPGELLVFKLGGALKREHLPVILRSEIQENTQGRKLMVAVARQLNAKVSVWCKQKPWLLLTKRKRENALANLRSIGDWSFRLSRNEGLHPYPSTFVHAIPSNLINALGIRGELAVDVFGGTGQTAAEVIKHGGSAITADSNFIASTIAKSRFTFLNPANRKTLFELSTDDLLKVEPSTPPDFENINEWFHRKTLTELCRVWAFIGRRRDEAVKRFLKVCFSAVVPLCTGRRGEQHGYFADNCPLRTGSKLPPYQDALKLFVSRVRKNVMIIERSYAALQKQDREPARELARVDARRVSVYDAKISDYGVQQESVTAVITSPPYLCMADYTLGQRLSYHWLAPKELDVDFLQEIGARRLRSSPDEAEEQYFQGVRAFARLVEKMLRKGGYLATVLGQPVAANFRSRRIIEQFDTILEEEGLEPLWHTYRRINWHRNHGYSRLERERVSVHFKP